MKRDTRKRSNVLKHGGIVAVKGLGGFHIACDAANDACSQTLAGEKKKKQ